MQVLLYLGAVWSHCPFATTPPLLLVRNTKGYSINRHFLRGVSVVAWMRSEPRKAVPLALLRGALLKVDVTVFWEVQAALLMVMLFFSFSRSEAPCPKSYLSPTPGLAPSTHLSTRRLEMWRCARGATRRLAASPTWRGA